MNNVKINVKNLRSLIERADGDCAECDNLKEAFVIAVNALEAIRNDACRSDECDKCFGCDYTCSDMAKSALEEMSEIMQRS